MEEIQNQGVDPNEKLQEEELLKETPLDEVRASIIEKYGLDEETNGELISKLAEDVNESNKRFSTVVKQKIRQRAEKERLRIEIEKLARTEQKPEDKPQPQTENKVNDSNKTFDQLFNEKFEERELNSLDLSDELKQEVKTYAKATGLTINKTLQSDYFKFLKQKDEANKKVEEASIGGKRRASSRKDFSAAKVVDFDLSTEEGRKDYEEYKKARK